MKRYKNKALTAIIALALTTTLTGCSNSGNSSNTSAAVTTNATTTANTTENITTTSNTSKENTSMTETEKIKDAIAKAYGEDYLPNMEIASEMLDSEFGLKPEMYDEISSEMPMIGFHPDRVVIVKAKSGKGDEVKTALNKAKDTKINDANQYPANLAKISVAQVLNHGDYYCFLIAGAPDDVSETDEAAMKFAQEQVQKGVDAFNNYFA